MGPDRVVRARTHPGGVTSPAEVGRRLRLLADIASTRGDGDLGHMYELTHQAMTATDADGAGLSLWVPESSRLVTMVNVGVFDDAESPFPDQEDYPLDEWGESQRVEECLGRLYTLDQEEVDPIARRYRAYLLEWQVASAMDLPVLVDGVVWGELTVARTAERTSYAMDDLWWASAVASQVGAAIGSAMHLRSLHRMATTDPLTGLPNRWAFDQQTGRLLSSGRSSRPIVVAVLDLNGLKSVNDALGHEAGDQLLIRFADLLRETATTLPASVVARLGGDEFCLVSGEHTVERVHDALSDLLDAATASLGSSAACGIAVLEPGDPTADISSALRSADAAQYLAKRSGATIPVIAAETETVEATDRRKYRDASDAPLAG